MAFLVQSDVSMTNKAFRHLLFLGIFLLSTPGHSLLQCELFVNPGSKSGSLINAFSNWAGGVRDNFTFRNSLPTTAALLAGRSLRPRRNEIGEDLPYLKMLNSLPRHILSRFEKYEVIRKLGYEPYLMNFSRQFEVDGIKYELVLDVEATVRDHIKPRGIHKSMEPERWSEVSSHEFKWGFSFRRVDGGPVSTEHNRFLYSYITVARDIVRHKALGGPNQSKTTYKDFAPDSNMVLSVWGGEPFPQNVVHSFKFDNWHIYRFNLPSRERISDSSIMISILIDLVGKNPTQLRRLTDMFPPLRFIKTKDHWNNPDGYWILENN